MLNDLSQIKVSSMLMKKNESEAFNTIRNCKFNKGCVSNMNDQIISLKIIICILLIIAAPLEEAIP